MYYTLNAFKATFGIDTIEYDNLIMHYLGLFSNAINDVTLTSFTPITNYQDQSFGLNDNIVPIKVWTTINTLELKTFGNTTGQVLTANVNYLALKIPGKNQIWGIKFFDRIVNSNQFLDINGTFGFDQLPADIESVLLNAVLTAVNYQATKSNALNNEQAGTVGSITSIKNLSSSVNYSIPNNYLKNAENLANGNLLAVDGISDILERYREYTNPSTLIT